ncbi:hypothetical protein [Elizabethkingia meningoseptica]|uniref:hypothetical protein n=1 Tax=Elizabethkingia meningoseptica TaxID=238 RepID=UPI0023AFE694|nr:hypothetical protein [Elizabethkingia meningoseptica]MDE5431831.1 hypothetical protein [Elizabethkingia meningoseptica]
MNTNSNNAAQTLFRFASLRSPQLTESKKNLGFIHRAETDQIKGFFDVVLEEWSAADGVTKFAALEKSAQNFVVADDFVSVKELENEYPELTLLGKTISRRDKITETIINNAEKEWSIKTSGRNANEIISQQKAFWDNLIYQTVTQKDFQIKEVIIQLIKAIHYLDANKLERTEETIKTNGEDFRTKASTAVVVFPEALVLDSTGENGKSPFTVNQSKIGDARIKYGRNLSTFERRQLAYTADIEAKASNTLNAKVSFEVLKNELEQLQKSYIDEYNQEYNKQYEAYQIHIKPEVERYEVEIKAVEATFTNETTDSEKEAAYQTVTPLNIPQFNFIFRQEIDLVSLNEKLTKESFILFIELFTDYGEELKLYIAQNPGTELNIQVSSSNQGEINGFLLSLNNSYTTYKEVLSKLNEEISSSLSKVLSLKRVPETQIANIGGALIPIKEEVSTATNAYFLQVVKSGILLYSTYLQFGFTVEDTSWSVFSVVITAETNQGSQQETLYKIPVSEGQIVLPWVLRNRLDNVNSIKIEIWFDNGSESKVELYGVPFNTIESGFLKIIKPQGGNSDKEQTDTPSVFQPKHFGVKRLGIADYLKVEQSIHAYVPGEVSNIENVMASELRHKSSTTREYSETTETTSKSQETEKLSDTTKASRTDMQTEVARELEKQQSYEAHTRFGKSGKWYFEAGGNYANNSSQHESTRQAVAKSQEITERALDRVLTKISEERVEKIIREYTETNVHEYDNRGRVTATTDPAEAKPQHISGVYRWVDKKMKNQIYNYGKRMMFEFMIPEPARLHALATKAVKAKITEPVDPRKAPNPHTMINANVHENILKYWADIYKVKLDEIPEKTKIVQESFPCGGGEDVASSKQVTVPEYYVCTSFVMNYKYDEYKKDGKVYLKNNITGYLTLYDHSGRLSYSNQHLVKQFFIDYQFIYLNSFDFDIIQTCELSEEGINIWKKEQFDKIIAAYEKAKEQFDEEVKAAAEEAVKQENENKERASIFYRSTEENVLKHNCIAYLLKSYNTLGQAMSEDDGQRMESFKMKLGDSLDQYTALAKFMEQAFEWSIMDYTFYPYYWANRAHWQDLYLSDELDPLFRSFLQAGMARVIVTVNPGFEDAVQFFMNTGRIWNGGEVPVIGDPLYLSIVDELRAPQGVPQGKYWITRVPTTLTILQAKSTGLEVEDALPIFPESDPENCENPQELEITSAFGAPKDIVMQNTPGTGSTLPSSIIKPI